MVSAWGPSHAEVRRLHRLATKRREREETSSCVLEGPDVVTAALREGVDIEYLLVTDDALEEFPDVISLARSLGVPIEFASAEGLARATDAKNPQSIAALARWRGRELDPTLCRGFALCLHDVRDPGNAGTLIRSAEAAGASAVYFTGDHVDPTNPKVLRATAGAAFMIPVVVTDQTDLFAAWHAASGRTLATVIHGGEELPGISLVGDVLVVIGNESAGLDHATVAACDGTLSITMSGRGESLNAGVAGAIIAFEAQRQRHSDPAVF